MMATATTSGDTCAGESSGNGVANPAVSAWLTLQGRRDSNSRPSTPRRRRGGRRASRSALCSARAPAIREVLLAERRTDQPARTRSHSGRGPAPPRRRGPCRFASSAVAPVGAGAGDADHARAGGTSSAPARRRTAPSRRSASRTPKRPGSCGGRARGRSARFCSGGPPRAGRDDHWLSCERSCYGRPATGRIDGEPQARLSPRVACSSSRCTTALIRTEGEPQPAEGRASPRGRDCPPPRAFRRSGPRRTATRQQPGSAQTLDARATPAVPFQRTRATGLPLTSHVNVVCVTTPRVVTVRLSVPRLFQSNPSTMGSGAS